MADCSLTECEAGGMRNFKSRKVDFFRPVSSFPQTEHLCFEIVPWIYYWTLKRSLVLLLSQKQHSRSWKIFGVCSLIFSPKKGLKYFTLKTK